MARDNAPVSHTCPMINEVISVLESLNQDDCSWYGEEDVIDIMEKIREANDKLRCWWNEKHEECEELEGRIYELERSVGDRDSEISDYIDTIEGLRSEIEQLEAAVVTCDGQFYGMTENSPIFAIFYGYNRTKMFLIVFTPLAVCEDGERTVFITVFNCLGEGRPSPFLWFLFTKRVCSRNLNDRKK